VMAVIICDPPATPLVIGSAAPTRPPIREGPARDGPRQSDRLISLAHAMHVVADGHAIASSEFDPWTRLTGPMTPLLIASQTLGRCQRRD